MQRAFTHRKSPRRIRPAVSVIALGALSAVLLAGCGGGGSAGDATSAAGTGVASAQNQPGAAPAPGAKTSPGAPSDAAVPPAADGSARAREVSKSAAPVVGLGAKVTKTASLDVRVKDIDSAAAKVRAIAAGLQAQVLAEQIGNGSPGAPPVPGPVPLQGKAGSTTTDTPSGFGTLTLSVPADKLDTALDQLARIGTVLQRNVSSQDVTAQYVDTQSRLKTQQASVERVRALMVQAKDLGQVVALESELSQREADLESLESQLGALKNSVDLSPLTVSLSTPGNEPVTNAGFVGGLRSGWDAFTASARGVLTVIGAVLPFALLFSLVGGPLVWSWRRRSHQGSAGPVNP